MPDRDDHDADELEPLQPLAEQEEAADRRDRGELRRQHGGDGHALAGRDDVDRAAEDLEEPGERRRAGAPAG